MASSMRNFFVTFVLALLIFGGLAFFFYDDLAAFLPQSETEESEDAAMSEEPSRSTSEPSEISVVLNGEVLNGLIVTKNADGEVLGAYFLRYNSGVYKIISCELSLSVSLYNEVGALVPLGDYLRIYTIEEAAKAVCALTGYSADFYLEVTPDSLNGLIEQMHNPHYLVRQEIHYVNPIYEDVSVGAVPPDYYKHVDAGEIALTAETLSVILEHYSLCDGADGHESYDKMLTGLYQSLFEQVMGEQKTIFSVDPDRFARALSGMKTNLDSTFLTEYADLLFKYTDADYTIQEIPYTTRDATLHSIKTADQ